MLCGFCWMNVPEIVSLLPYVLYLMSHFRIVCPTEKWWEISRFICKNYASWNIICWRKSMFFGVSFKMAAWVLVATEGSTLSTCSLATARQEGTFRSTPTAPLEFSQCEECGQGRGTLPGVRGQVECLPCPGGTFQNGNSDQGICKPCPLGTFRTANSSSSEGCLPCQAHTFADVPGLDACKPCPSFASQPTPGQGWCLCDIGSYKDPSDTATQGATLSCLSCDSLILGSTTRAAEGLSGPTGTPCVCPAGTFWHKPHQDNPFAECKSCGKGLVCRGGLQARSPVFLEENHWLGLNNIEKHDIFHSNVPVFSGLFEKAHGFFWNRWMVRPSSIRPGSFWILDWWCCLSSNVSICPDMFWYWSMTQWSNHRTKSGATVLWTTGYRNTAFWYSHSIRHMVAPSTCGLV